MRVRRSEAFAPSAITNFFEISYHARGGSAGATGGGYVLTKGTTTRALARDGGGRVATVVNGDPGYDARTTRRAAKALLSEQAPGVSVELDQTSDTPIGGGFGASAAAATSAVYAVASAAGIARRKDVLASYAYRAEVEERTGLGTVSVIYDGVGAGAITVPGEPGRSEFLRVKIPKGLRIVTGFLAPFDKRDALSSKPVSDRINALGRESLRSFVSDPTLANLASEGERFSRRLGLESPEVVKMIAAAKAAGAEYASQNMIGYSVHSLVFDGGSGRVASALRSLSPDVRVDEFGVGRKRASVLKASRR
ncbi:MAG: hypothetical protein JRN27_05905 [Nitrososphaerota archaeon]|nr:hypothetical protein [Nitrososphaerota archaeon]MDG6975605.1 hypothetical protein [Nitrososphaerota archaeon]MDG6981284.1 hypothetical protein [Nitrososphaerota archaeon]MDG7016126.1 hypothetical protein [Nitrososphaerota archaeon]